MHQADLHLAILQFNPGRDVVVNLAQWREMAAAAVAAGECDLLVLPENCLCLGDHTTVAAAGRSADAWGELLRPQVCELGVATVFGGIPVTDEAGATRNCSLVLGPDGKLLANYAKVHLFQLNPGHPGGVDETALYTPGTRPVLFELGGWRIGLSICYDLRFPELYRSYAPADLLLCTAAFTRQTGAAHWHTLLRARAIENQCFVAAAGVCGSNPDTHLELYGHSLVADPWGELLGEALESGPAVLRLRLDHTRLAAVRARLPALAQYLAPASVQGVVG